MENEYMVPLSALKAERAKGKQKIKQMEEKMEEILNKTNDVGAENLPPETPQSPDYLTEFAELIKDPIYADSHEHIDEIREYAHNNNLPLKTAYNALFAEEKYEKIRQKAESDALHKQYSKQSRKLEAVEFGGGIGKKVAKLNQTQLDVAHACGMTPEEYVRYS